MNPRSDDLTQNYKLSSWVLQCIVRATAQVSYPGLALVREFLHDFGMSHVHIIRSSDQILRREIMSAYSSCKINKYSCLSQTLKCQSNLSFFSSWYPSLKIFSKKLLKRLLDTVWLCQHVSCMLNQLEAHFKPQRIFKEKAIDSGSKRQTMQEVEGYWRIRYIRHPPLGYTVAAVNFMWIETFRTTCVASLDSTDHG